MALHIVVPALLAGYCIWLDARGYASSWKIVLPVYLAFICFCRPPLGIILAAALCSVFLRSFVDASVWLPASLGAVSLFFLVVSPFRVRADLKVRIAPYFKELIKDADTFAGGYRLARNCRNLDKLALNSGLMPVSEFGYADDLLGEDLVWHDPQNGLRTFSGLLESLKSNPDALPDTADIISDLEKISKALEIAAAGNIRFCLLLWIGQTVSNCEMNRRKGYV
jgi:hypothetical protein